MLLLDVILDDEFFHRHRAIRRITPDTILNNPHSTDPVGVDSMSADTLNTVADTLNAMPNTADTVSATHTLVNTIGTGGGSSSPLFWSIAIVLLALALCVYFAIAYRRSTAGAGLISDK